VDTVRPYQSIVDWVTSGGTLKTDWYTTPVDRALTFINGR
jgi:hypothetical protein